MKAKKATRRAGEAYRGEPRVVTGAWCVGGRHSRCMVLDCACPCHQSPDRP